MISAPPGTEPTQGEPVVQPAQAQAPSASNAIADLESLFKDPGTSSQLAGPTPSANAASEPAKDDPAAGPADKAQPAQAQSDAAWLETAQKLADTDPEAFRRFIREQHDHPLAKLVQGEASNMARAAGARASAAAAEATRLADEQKASAAEFEKVRGLLQRAFQTDDWPDRETAREELLGPMRETYERYASLMDPMVKEQVDTTVQAQVRNQLEAVGRDAYVQAIKQATTHDDWTGLGDAYDRAANQPNAPAYYKVLRDAWIAKNGYLSPKQVDERVKAALEDDRTTGYSQLPPFDNTPSQGLPRNGHVIDRSARAEDLISQGLQESRARARS